MNDIIKTLVSGLLSRLPRRARFFYYYRMQGVLGFPEVVNIELTDLCNAQCVMCPREKLTRPTGLMDFALYRKIIDELSRKKEVKEIHLNGFGESLLYKDINKAIRYAKSKGIKKTYFVTNASLLTEDAARGLIESGLDAIKFSFYADDPATYESIHKRLRYEEVKANIERFFAIRRALGAKNPSVALQFLPQAENASQWDGFLRRWGVHVDKRKKDTISQFTIHNWTDGRSYRSVDKSARKITCGFPFYSLQILYNGDIALCCYDFNGKLILGNVKDASLLALWNSPQYRRVRTLHRLREFSKLPPCSACDQLRILED
jgi:radical SAM protein with 4Fe4S-binding SPASM domain